MTSRFGEICWAQGGAGYGWWPSIIYDPRLTVEPARSQARKHLGSRHLVYFFQCPDSPFSILPVKQIKRWVDGLSEDLHLGRAAKSHGKQRHRSFQEALRVACLEMDKPVHERLDWEHLAPSSPQTLSPQKPALKKRAAVAQNKPQRGPSRALAEATVRSSSLVSSRPPQMVSSFRLADTASSSVAVASGDLEYRSAAATEWTIRKKRRLSNGA